jgi:hypothetical protein
MQRDRAVDGRPLRSGGREFFKGLGMHSRSSVTFDLAGKYRSFITNVGLDDTTSGTGTVTCAIELDGRRAFEVASLSRTTSPSLATSQSRASKSANGSLLSPTIDLSGVQRLTLIVDFGELGDVQDRVNWSDAVLLR